MHRQGFLRSVGAAPDAVFGLELLASATPLNDCTASRASAPANVPTAHHLAEATCHARLVCATSLDMSDRDSDAPQTVSTRS